jgi:hypothetical protein
MKRGILYLAIGIGLFIASPGTADIIRNLENPPDNQEVSGISLVSGWAFSTTGSPVTIRLFIDGKPAENIACCGPRPDVQTLYPVAPLNSGFGLLINFDDRLDLNHQLGMTDGTHTVSVLIEAGSDAEIVTHTVTVVKPGGRVGEDRLVFGFLSDLDTSTAASLVDPTTEEVIVAPVEVTDKTTQNKRKSTLRLAWRAALQSFVTVGAASGTEFAAVQSIFTSKCTTACHSGGSPAAGLDLSEGQAFKELVPTKSTQVPTQLQVAPGDFSSSYLYQKVIAGGAIASGTKRMPPDCSGDACLSDTQIETIKTWITAGAPPPQ